MLLQFGIILESCKVKETDADGCTLLRHVVKLNDPEATSTVINKGVNIDAQTQKGETPLSLAAKHNHPASLKVLLKSGADPNITANNGASLLAEAAMRGRVEMVLALRKHGADSAAFDNVPLHLVAYCFHIVYLVENEHAECHNACMS